MPHAQIRLRNKDKILVEGKPTESITFQVTAKVIADTQHSQGNMVFYLEGCDVTIDNKKTAHIAGAVGGGEVVLLEDDDRFWYISPQSIWEGFSAALKKHDKNK